MPSQPVIRLTDDDPAAREAVERLLRARGYLVQRLAPSQAAGADCSGARGCLLASMDAAEASGLLKAGQRRLPLILLTDRADIPACVRAIKAGAEDVLLKPLRGPLLLAAVESAVASDRRRRMERREKRAVENKLRRLTARERQVFGMVARGRLNKQIALQLGITEKTVKVHRARVMTKMRARSLAELVLLSLKCDGL